MKRVFFLLTLTIFCTPAFSQEIPIKNSIAFQSNIFLDRNLYNGVLIQPVWALRYGYNLTDNFRFGPEISGSRTFFRSVPDMKSTSLTIGGFARYSMFSDKRISPFAELSLYYYHGHFVPGAETSSSLTEGFVNDFRGYLAPGVSVKSRSQKLSFDLMYKFSPDKFINGKNSVFSYRLTFNF